MWWFSGIGMSDDQWFRVQGVGGWDVSRSR